jgi:hypothetical protein
MKGFCIIPILAGLLFTSIVGTTIVAVSDNDQPKVRTITTNGTCYGDDGYKIRCKITRKK